VYSLSVLNGLLELLVRPTARSPEDLKLIQRVCNNITGVGNKRKTFLLKSSFSFINLRRNKKIP